MSHEIKIHDVQTLILRELLFRPEASYGQLRKASGLDSDLFKYHIAELVKSGYVDKLAAGRYALSRKGKEHANKLDTDNNTIERQPKVSVVLLVQNQDNPEKYLVQQRLKQPYFGFWGRLGGKVRWGETFEEAAAREFTEETALTGEFVFRSIYRKIDYDKDSGDLLEDKVFVLMQNTGYSGSLMEEFEGGKNAWMTQEELASQDKFFGSAYEFVELMTGASPYVTKKHFYTKDEY